MKLKEELAVGLDAVSKASHLCAKVQHTLCDSETIAKKDRSPVTIADFGSQAVIITDILKAFPRDSIVGEEEASALRNDAALRARVLSLVQEVNPGISERAMLRVIDAGSKVTDYSGRYWTLDPIDGTKGFLRGEQYAIALALVEKGRVVLGLLGCPNLPLKDDEPDGRKGCLLYAAFGNSAFQKNLAGGEAERISVNNIADPREAWFCESVEKGHSSHDVQQQISDELGITREPYRIDSQCKYAVVARGGVPIYIRLARGKEYQEKIWDHAAGSFIVQQAGGAVSDFHDKALNLSGGRTLRGNRGILATNGVLHPHVLEAINKVIGD